MDLLRLLFGDAPDASCGSNNEIAMCADRRDLTMIKVVTMISAKVRFLGL
jgi:hypothetical protein